MRAITVAVIAVLFNFATFAGNCSVVSVSAGCSATFAIVALDSGGDRSHGNVTFVLIRGSGRGWVRIADLGSFEYKDRGPLNFLGEEPFPAEIVATSRDGRSVTIRYSDGFSDSKSVFKTMDVDRNASSPAARPASSVVHEGTEFELASSFHNTVSDSCPEFAFARTKSGSVEALPIREGKDSRQPTHFALAPGPIPADGGSSGLSGDEVRLWLAGRDLLMTRPGQLVRIRQGGAVERLEIPLSSAASVIASIAVLRNGRACVLEEVSGRAAGVICGSAAGGNWKRAALPKPLSESPFLDLIQEASQDRLLLVPWAWMQSNNKGRVVSSTDGLTWRDETDSICQSATPNHQSKTR